MNVVDVIPIPQLQVLAASDLEDAHFEQEDRQLGKLTFNNTL